jgi:hypothetical protein
MAEDSNTTGTVPDPIPRVRDELAGGTNQSQDEATRGDNSGTLPDPIPSVREEGPGGTNLNQDEDTEGRGGVLPSPTRQASGEEPGSAS